MSDPILMGGATGAGVSQEGRIFCYPYIGDAMTQYEFHPLADIFPMLSADELRALAADIGANGLVDPITLHDGAILDGRNRYAACLAAGVDPRFTTFDGPDALAFVLAKNLHRRHLTASQRATLAVDLLPRLEERAKERQGARHDLVANLPQGSVPHKARDEAAALVGVSPRYVSEAKAIAAASPELLAGMRDGSVTLQDAKRQTRNTTLREAIPDKPTGRYRVIYADPPWKYNDAMAISKDGLGESYGPADAHHPQMTPGELCALPIADMAEDDAVLFLWVTSPLLPVAFQIIPAWGFQYKASFVWDKIKHNMGHYNSVRHEFLLVCTRGSCTPEVAKLFDSVQSIERTNRHSEKPSEFREIIDTIYPSGNRIELFARAKHEGWATWGNEL